MSVIKARIFTIQRLLNNEILVPYEMLKVETIYLQFRLLLEMLCLSTISTRKRGFEATWPRSEKEYQPSEIRKYLGDELEEHFPYPFRRAGDEPGFTKLDFVDRPLSEDEVYRFFNKCIGTCTNLILTRRTGWPARLNVGSCRKKQLPFFSSCGTCSATTIGSPS